MIQTLKTNKPQQSIFSTEKTSLGTTEVYKLLNTVTGESVTIIPSKGAVINSLQLKKEKVFEIIDGSKSESELKIASSQQYKGSILFPFPNRIKGGMYTYEGKIYQFERNNLNNAIHGLCNEASFEVLQTEIKKTKVSISLCHKLDGKHPAYPFEIELTIVYELSKKGLSIWTEVKNVGTKTAPFGLGWHPYFKTGSKVDTLLLKLPLHRCIQTDETQIPTGKTSEGFNFMSFEAIDSVHLDNGYLISAESKHSSIKIKDESQDITLEISLHSGYGYFQIYTPDHRNSIAIEPQTCAANAFNNKQGLIELKAGEKKILHYAISIN